MVILSNTKFQKIINAILIYFLYKKTYDCLEVLCILFLLESESPNCIIPLYFCRWCKTKHTIVPKKIKLLDTIIC